MSVMLVKLKGHYTNVVLSTFSLIKTAIWTDECEGIKRIKNFISRYTSSDAGIRTSYTYHCDINVKIVKNNVRIFDMYQNWNMLWYRKAL